MSTPEQRKPPERRRPVHKPPERRAPGSKTQARRTVDGKSGNDDAAGSRTAGSKKPAHSTPEQRKLPGAGCGSAAIAC